MHGQFIVNSSIRKKIASLPESRKKKAVPGKEKKIL